MQLAELETGEKVATAAVIARRARLTGQLADSAALIFAGSRSPRNYADAAYPFRASSHFIYLTGLQIENAVLAIGGRETTLYVPAPGAGDELWHGPMPTLDAIATATGVSVRPLDELSQPDDEAGTIKLVRARDVARQELRLERSLEKMSAADERVTEAMITLRLVHDDAAIAELRAAAASTEAAHRKGMAVTRAALHEYDVRGAMESALMMRGSGTAYTSIVTVHGEVLHNNFYHRVLGRSDLVLADVGGESPGGWAGDVTRTWPVSGTFSPTQRAIYECVLASQHAAIEAVRPGARYRDVHLTACRVLTEGLVALGILTGDVDQLVADGVHALLFPHGVGHLIGLDVHDMEDLGDRAGYASGRERSSQFGLAYLRCDRDLEPGMAVTIEPGFYNVPAILRDDALMAPAKGRLDLTELAKYSDVRGIRIEDDVLVTSGEADVLTASIPKTIDEVEAAVGIEA